MGPDVVAIVPAYNEADRIQATVHSLLTTGLVHRVLVVDDGSADETAERAHQAGAAVHRLSRNGGKTRALQVGVDQSTEDVLLFVDADLAETAGRTTELLPPVMDGWADMTIAGWPSAGGEGGFGLVKRMSQWFIHRLTGCRINNPLSGQRAMHRSVWTCWRGSVGYGFEVAFTIDALRAGKRIAEVSLPLSHRHMGRSLKGFMHRGRQLYHIVLAVGRRCFS